MTSILLIEDYDGVLETTAELLELEGYQVVTAKNGKEGLRKLADFIPDLIICDVLMPVMDGLTLLGILGNEAKFSKIPFIFFSALTEKCDMKKGLDSGADAYVSKPYELRDLLGTIERCLLKSRHS